MDQETNIQIPNTLGPTDSPTSEQGSDIDPIRTETVFSRLPLHILSKNGPIPEISIVRKTPEGKLQEKWEVSYNQKHGQARQLAYDVHTLVIERAIEEAFEEARRVGRAFPKFISLKSLNEIANRLGGETRDTSRIKKALQQNAGILIDCFVKFRGNDGVEYTLEGTFSPYGIFFYGQKLPDGTKANEVLVNLNDPYFEAWSKAPTRPLDYNYKAVLPPTARRFYELVSYAMYGAIKNNQPTARYRYSEYCRRAPQMRYDTFDEVKKQMNKVHKHHRDSGYIVKVRYEQTTDEQGRVDWWMIYNPGPRAFTEFVVFTGKKPKLSEASKEQLPAGESLRRQKHPRQRRLALEATTDPEPTVIIDYRMVAELTKRGIAEQDGRTAIAGLPPGFPLLDVLEWADLQVEQSRGRIENPPGFYISLLQKRSVPPPTFETASQRAAREEAKFAQRQALLEEQDAQFRASEEKTAALNAQIDALPEAARQDLVAQAKAELLSQHPSMKAFFQTHPDSAIHDGALRSRMRQLITQGWDSHYATNSAIRQDTPLQESATALHLAPTLPNLPQAILAHPEHSRELHSAANQPQNAKQPLSGPIPEVSTNPILAHADRSVSDTAGQGSGAYLLDLQEMLITPQLPAPVQPAVQRAPAETQPEMVASTEPIDNQKA